MHELVSFLTDVLGVIAVDAALEGNVDLSRQLLGPAGARHHRRSRGALLGSVEGLKLMEMEDAGCLLRLRRHVLRQISRTSPNAIVDEEGRRRSRRPAPSLLLAGDLGCLMNMAGKLKREGSRDRGPPRGGGAGRHDRRAADRRGERLSAWRSPPRAFKQNAHEALADAQLQKALGHVRSRLHRQARARRPTRCPSSRRCATPARDIKNHTLAHLDLYLEAYEDKVTAAGGQVHWAETAAEARAHRPRHLPQARRAHRHQGQVDDHRGDRPQRGLEEAGIRPVETDLGEYIIQLRGEHPSHIIAPAVHLNKDQVESDFRRVHDHLPPDRDLSEPSALLGEARARAARNISTPTSASPAPISSSPRPARR